MSFSQRNDRLREQFPSLWQASTADSNLTLYGFRRFKTAHLLNLRYLEAEINELSNLVYQLGLGLDIQPSAVDRLGLRHAKRDEVPPSIEKEVTKELIDKLRRLLKEYDEAIIQFSTILSMDTFSLLDDDTQRCMTTGLSLPEMHKTRLVRVDQSPRTRQDPLQRSIHHILRLLRYWKIAKSANGDVEHNTPSRPARAGNRQTSQNTSLIADIISRVIIAMLTAMFLLVPLATLSPGSAKSVQIAIIAAFVVVFASLVSVTLRASNLEMMIVSAAYAAIISVFVSNGAGSNH